MKARLSWLLCLSATFCAPAVFADGSILIEPFPAYTQENPLVVESPLTLRWHQGRTLRIQVRSDTGVVFRGQKSESYFRSLTHNF